MADRESRTGPIGEADTKRTRPWLRRVGVVVGCLLAGAIINVLVAWGCAAFSGNEWTRRFRAVPVLLHGQQRWAEVHQSRGFGRIQSSVGSLIGGVIEESSGELLHQWNGVKVSTPIVEMPGWSRLGSSAAGRCPTIEDEEACGWPFLSLWCATTEYRCSSCLDRTSSDSIYQPSNALHFEFWTARRGRDHMSERQLPLVPIWTGFAANAALYGMVAWCALFVAPVHVVRRRRAVRGLCSSCAYDLRGADHGKCPECGEAVAGKRRQPNSRTAKQVEE